MRHEIRTKELNYFKILTRLIFNPLSKTISLLIWALGVCCALSMPVAWAQGSAIAKSVQVQEKIKSLLDPVSGLNSELQLGLQRIERTCAIIANNKLIESRQNITNAEQVYQQKLSEDLATAKETWVDLKLQVKTTLGQRQQSLSSSNLKCDASKLNASDACKLQRAQSENLTTVAVASDYFYQEFFERLRSYEKSLALEAKGCTRPGFTQRLWTAEKTHLMPAFTTSAQAFMGLLD
jgi:hypothetical protein